MCAKYPPTRWEYVAYAAVWIPIAMYQLGCEVWRYWQERREFRRWGVS